MMTCVTVKAKPFNFVLNRKACKGNLVAIFLWLLYDFCMYDKSASSHIKF